MPVCGDSWQVDWVERSFAELSISGCVVDYVIAVVATEIWAVVLQAWEYAKAMGRMSVQFDLAGHVVSCSGRVTLPIPKNSQILSNIVGTPEVTKFAVQV